MMAQLPRLIGLNVTVAVGSFLVVTLEASPQATGSEGTSESAAKVGKMPQWIIQVETANGKPLPKTTVVCIDPSTHAVLKGTTIQGGSERFQTDVHGRFSLPWNGTNVAVMVANDKGFSLAQGCDLIKSPAMVVRPWGRIEGRRINRGQPVVGQRLKYGLAMRFLVSEELQGTISVANEPVVTDSKGQFVFEFVPPVEIILLGMRRHPEKEFTILQLAEVEPGKTAQIEIATQGGTVVGHFELDPALAGGIDLLSFDGGLAPDMDMKKASLLPSIPKEFDTPERRAKWWRDWYQTDAGRQRVEMYSRLYRIEIHADNSFIADLVEPGKYWMSGDFGDMEGSAKRAAVVSEHVEIPQPGKDGENEPFDMGKATVKAVVNLNTGDVAPDFSFKILDGPPLKLSALRGKYVLLDFRATWAEPCIAEIPNLKATHDAFGKDGRFVMVSLSVDSDQGAPRRFARNQGIAWTEGFLGGWAWEEVKQSYGVYSIPAIFLIGPDGKVLATDLRGPKIKEAVAAALAH
jgi:peroxiredoxin